MARQNTGTKGPRPAPKINGKNRVFLLVGSSGTEHQMARALVQSQSVSKVYVLPGNAGSAFEHDNIVNVNHIMSTDTDAILNFARRMHVSVIIPGDEKIYGTLKAACDQSGQKCLAPTAKVEALFADQEQYHKLMKQVNVPCVQTICLGHIQTHAFSDIACTGAGSCDILGCANFTLPSNIEFPFVVDFRNGLTDNKSMVPKSRDEAEYFLRSMAHQQEFIATAGTVGTKVYLMKIEQGDRVTINAFSDGKTMKCLPAVLMSQEDYNITAPVPKVDNAMQEKIEKMVIKPILTELAKDDMTYVGMMALNLVFTNDGPKVTSIQTRFGEKEIQAALPLLNEESADLAEVVMASVGELNGLNVADVKLRTLKSRISVVRFMDPNVDTIPWKSQQNSTIMKSKFPGTGMVYFNHNYSVLKAGEPYGSTWVLSVCVTGNDRDAVEALAKQDVYQLISSRS